MITEEDIPLIQYALNESLNKCLERFGIKVNDEIIYNRCLEDDYEFLLDRYITHLQLIEKEVNALK